VGCSLRVLCYRARTRPSRSSVVALRPDALRAFALRTSSPLTPQRAPCPPMVKGPLRRFAPLTTSSQDTSGRDRGVAGLWRATSFVGVSSQEARLPARPSAATRRRAAGP